MHTHLYFVLVSYFSKRIYVCVHVCVYIYIYIKVFQSMVECMIRDLQLFKEK